LSQRQITVTSVDNEQIEKLLSEEKGIFYSLLERIQESHRQSLAEKKGGN
jgi:DNA replication initiation complex subunit (GINS family)